MADAIDSGVCQLVGLGRTAVLEPDLPRTVLLNPAFDDDHAIGMSHKVRGLWLSQIIPAKIVGAGLPIHFFYYSMQRLGAGLKSDPDASLPWIATIGAHNGIVDVLRGFAAWFGVAKA